MPAPEAHIPDVIASYPEAIHFLENGLDSRPPTLAGHEASRLRTAALLQHFDNPQDNRRTVHVAGTAGKGSTTHAIEALLRASGMHTNMRTSPFIYDWREGLMHDGQYLPEDIILRGVNRMLGPLRAVQQHAGVLTRFEARNALAYTLFSEVGGPSDYNVIEVGMGGKHDATNVMTRSDKVCAITTLGICHPEILGPTRAAIAAQKAGIILPGNTVISAPQHPQALAKIRDTTRAQQGHLTIADRKAYPYLESDAITNPLFRMSHYAGNAAVALTVVGHVAQRDGFELTADTAIDALNTLTIPGRCERLELADKTAFLDIGISAVKVQPTVNALRQQFPGQEFGVVLTQPNSPDVTGVLQILRTISDTLVAVQYAPEGPRAINATMQPEELASKARDQGFSNAAPATYAEAAEHVRSPGGPALWLVTGRPEVLGPMKRALVGSEQR
ncbi:MAG TPA: hypothetical protein VD735_03415 [Candidatus Saccharimonadales bacterium]|nr:hypothetical protein [Candidatus Saccharimonadales bacterium]